jgi:hypothetical protein
VTVAGDPLEADISLSKEFAAHVGTDRMHATLHPTGKSGCFLAATDLGVELPVAFADDESQRSRYLHLAGRALVRT